VTPRHRRSGLTVRVGAFSYLVVALSVLLFVARNGVVDPSLAAVGWTVLVASSVVGLVGPLAAIGLVRVSVDRAPGDLVVGCDARFDLAVSLPPWIDAVAVHVEGSTSPDAVWSLPAGSATVTAAPERRGVYRELHVVLGVHGPLGMVHVLRRRVVPLGAVLHVGPAPVAPGERFAAGEGEGRDDRMSLAVGVGDQVRSVRPYRSGDPAHLVHWPSTARVGDLVVRELEPPARPDVVVVVDLGPVAPASGLPQEAEPDPAVEAAVARAAGVAVAALRSGSSVVLCTSDLGVPVSKVVSTPLQVQRRLAAATPGPVGAAPARSAATVVVSAVDGAGR